MLYNILAVFVGGGLGSLLRFGMSMLVIQYYRAVFPLATFLSNILSCIIFGLAIYFLGEKMKTEFSLWLLIITGFCGGFSTFSAFSYDTVELIRTGNMMYAILNILVSVSACIAVIYMLTRSNA
jgi:CrcB protein